MQAALRRRLALLSILLVVGVVTGAAIIVTGAEKAIPGTSNDYISVVKQQQTGQPPDQTTRQQAQFEERARNLTAIAIKDRRVGGLLAGKNYTVVGIAVVRVPSVAPGVRPIDTAALFLKVDGKFYKINIDITHEKVISVAERICYGPACND